MNAEVRKHLEALKRAEEEYRKTSDAALLPCSKDIEALREYVAILKLHRTYVVREAIDIARSLRKREGQTPLWEEFSLECKRFTPEQVREWSIQAEDTLKECLDKGEIIETLRKLVYYYTFTNNHRRGL